MSAAAAPSSAASAPAASAPAGAEAVLLNGLYEWQLDEKDYIFENRLAKGVEHRNLGNAHFDKNEWGMALRRYARALYHCAFDEMQSYDLMDKHREQARVVQTPCRLNYVVCVLKCREEDLPLPPIKPEDRSDGGEMVQEQLEYCDHLLCQVMKDDPDSAKAYYRRAQLQMFRGDLGGARDSLRDCQKRQGNAGGGVREAFITLREMERDVRRREREMYGGMIQDSNDHERIERQAERLTSCRKMLWWAVETIAVPIQWPMTKLWSAASPALHFLYKDASLKKVD